MANLSFSPVTPHIARLDFKGGSASVFLVKGEDGWTLVDTGEEKQAEAVMQAVMAFTKNVKPHTLILSHGHPDNAGGVLAIRKAWDLKVAAGRNEIQYMIEPYFYRKIEGRSPLNYIAMVLQVPVMLGRGVDLPLDDGSKINGMTAYQFSGHTPGLVALLHPGDKALLCAEVWSNTGGKLQDPAGAFTINMGEMHKAQKRLAQLDFDTLIPSRGPEIMNDGKRQAIAYVEKKLGKDTFATVKPAGAKA
jgi:hydroxyacylglutathione hydrolase